MGRLLLSSRNPTGYQGVYAPKARAGTAKPFVAMLTASGVQRHIGWFRTAVEAAACYTRVRHALDARSQKASRSQPSARQMPPAAPPAASPPPGSEAGLFGPPAAAAPSDEPPLPMEVEEL